MTRVLPAGLSYPCAVQFDDHEIWGAPVQAPVSPEQERASRPAATATATAGRLYKSAGCEETIDAIVALPGRRHTMAHPIAHAFPHPGTQAAPAAEAPAPARVSDTESASAQAPITINSRLPRRPQIEDPAIAEVLAPPPIAPVAPLAPPLPRGREHSGFTSWFRASAVRGAAPTADPHAWADPAALAPEPTPAPAPTPSRTAAPRPDRRAAEDWSAIAPTPSSTRVSAGLPTLTARGFGLLVFAVTVVVGIVDVHGSGSFGSLTGIVFLLATVAGSWLLEGGDRWAGRVLPTYALIGAILVAGQFSSVAPGRSIIGQALLIIAGLISLAPWLAVATVVATVLPRLRRA